MNTSVIARFLGAGAMAWAAAPVGWGLALAPGLTADQVCDGITGGTALAPLPDGRILIAEQTGAIRVVENDRMLESPAITLATDSTWERGVLGLALDPGFPAAPHVYVHWTAAAPGPHFRISRFTLTGNTLDPASEVIVFEGDNQNDIRAHVPGGHQGGGIAFGADGTLFASIGEMTTMTPAQRLDTFLGKVIRINRDGSIPENNPFVTKAQGKYRALYAIGVRNPWSLAVQPGTGRLFANDVGDAGYEEVNEITAGGNYGWPEAEGRVETGRFTDPIFDYDHRMGKSIGGGCFYSAAPGAAHAFPAEWTGRYLVMDYMAGWLGWLDESAKPHPALRAFAKDLAKPTAVAIAADGSVLVLERNTWLKDAAFKPRQGWLTRIRPAVGGRPAAPATSSEFPASWAKSTFEKGSVPYRVIIEPWRPGVTREHRLRLPAGQKLAASADGGSFAFPAGTVLITHFSTGGRRVQTSVIAIAEKGAPHAAAYRWNGTEATLLADGGVAQIGGQPWIFPAPTTQLVMPPIVPGYECALTPANLPEGELTPLLAGPLPATRLAPVDDAGAPLEARVRSFLDVNCAACHRPGGVGRGLYDARFTTALPQQQVIDGPLISGDLGVAGAKVVVPGAPEKSMLLIRLLKPVGDPMRMPPGCTIPTPPPIVPLLEKWIGQLK